MESVCVAEDFLISTIMIFHPAVDVTALVREARKPVSAALPTIITWFTFFFITWLWFMSSVWALGALRILSV